MKISIQKELLNQFQTLKVGVLVLKGLENHQNSDISYQLLWRKIDEIKSKDVDLENDVWSKAFNDVGIDIETTPSHISLLKRITESVNGLPNISNAVNCINLVQLDVKSPIGIHDIDKVSGDIVIGKNTKELDFPERGHIETSINNDFVEKDEIVYADDKNVITRNWANKQGRKTLVNSDTKNAIAVVDTLDKSEGEINAILSKLSDIFNTFLHPKCISSGIVSSKENTLDLDDLKEEKTFKKVDIKGLRIINRDEKIIDEIVNKGVEEVLPGKDRLRELLMSGKRIRVYQGFDPTAPTLHIGHTVMMRKLELFRQLGHEVFMLIGDFTGRIGDPTDKGAARTKLTESQVLENLKLYKQQASSLIDIENSDNPVTVVFNNDWLGKLRFADIVDIASEFTVQQMIKRDMFQKRLQEDKPIYLHEFLYPLMQGFDSVALDVDIEVGGSDQLFNMLAGRTLVSKLLKKDKFVISGKLLTTAGGKKMGKSEGNMIMLSDSPENIFGKVMAFTDEQIVEGFELLTNTSLDEVKSIENELKSGTNPMELKKKLAWTIVAELKGKENADKAKQYFEGVFQKKESNVELEEVKVSKDEMNILDLLIESGMCKSKSEGRRLIEQGAVSIDEKKVQSYEDVVNTKEKILKVGRRVVKII